MWKVRALKDSSVDAGAGTAQAAGFEVTCRTKSRMAGGHRALGLFIRSLSSWIPSGDAVHGK
jgi:hypothetical protein